MRRYDSNLGNAVLDANIFPESRTALERGPPSVRVYPTPFGSHSFLLTTLCSHHFWGPIVGPLVAVISFVCSVGNIPLAAVLWNRGISFGGEQACRRGTRALGGKQSRRESAGCRAGATRDPPIHRLQRY